MAISGIRRLAEEDMQRLHKTASRFVKNWGISTKGFDSDWDAVVFAVIEEERYTVPGNHKMVSAWRKAFARALREKPCKNLAVAYGVVGYYVD